jgi:hypothetical protein
MEIRSINPTTEVTLENGKTSLLTKKFKYEKKTPDKEIRFQPQFDTASIL